MGDSWLTKCILEKAPGKNQPILEKILEKTINSNVSVYVTIFWGSYYWEALVSKSFFPGAIFNISGGFCHGYGQKLQGKLLSIKNVMEINPRKS